MPYFKVLLVVALLLMPVPASAQSTCVSRARGVPGLSGAPLWTDPIAPSTKPKNTNLDDPRWVGSTRLYFPPDMSSSVSEATVRAVVEGTVLHLSFEVIADPGGATQPDTVWLGLGKNATEAAVSTTDNDYFLIEIPLGGGIPTTLSLAHEIDTETTTTPEAFRAFTNEVADTTWTQDLAPTWVTTDLIRYWVGDSTVPYEWAVNIKIDLAAVGIDPPGGASPTLDAKLFVAGFVETLLGHGWVYQWPTNAVFVDTSDPDNVNPIDSSTMNPTAWGTVTLPTSFSAPCTDGIRLSFMQVGADPPPENLINVPTGASTADNLYFARPDWSGWGAVVDDAIKARFRIANWGSMIADPAAPWTEAANNVLNDAPDGHMEFPCPVGTALCGVLPAGDNHQCMLVELSKGTASTVDPLKFANDSVYRNMDFDDTSTLVREAEINIKGLKPRPGFPKRDTYIYVKTVNMPAPTSEQLFLPRDEMYRAVKVAKHPPPSPQPGKPGGRPGEKPIPAPPKPAVGAKAQKAPEPPPLDPDLAKDAYGHLTDSWPTYEVHVYYDTGGFITVRGKKYRALKPMVPFGYFLDHVGPYFGFEHHLEGSEGTQLTQVGPSFYKVEIVNDGVAKVKSTITALEKPSGPGMCDCKGCCQPPPVKVEIKPTCHCRVVKPGTAGELGLGLSGLLALALAAGLRRRSRGRPD
jgi:hypothetical protein